MTDNTDQKCKIGLDPIEMGKTFELIGAIHENVKTLVKTVNKQNGRIGKLENWRWLLLGGGTVLFVIISFAINYLLRV